MTVTCIVCGTIFKSLLVDANQALEEISQGFSAHVAKSHKEPIASIRIDVAKVIHLATWLLLADLTTATDEAFDAKHNEVRQELARILHLSAEVPTDLTGKVTQSEGVS